ncbi:MAG: hypothetical protein ACI8XO_003560 [Verrucomicrobiales bacterium]
MNAALVAEGFEIEQLAENPVAAGVPTPIPFDLTDLAQYTVIVLGSNNAEYTTSAKTLVPGKGRPNPQPRTTPA